MSDIASKPELLPIEPVERIVLTEEEKKRPIWELILDRAHKIPEEEMDRVPHDGSVNHDHYLYGAPKKEVE
jgi:hypothetical protein